jgi:hypothetical protein
MHTIIMQAVALHAYIYIYTYIHAYAESDKNQVDESEYKMQEIVWRRLVLEEARQQSEDIAILVRIYSAVSLFTTCVYA